MAFSPLLAVCSGALDITEEVGAAVGIPHVSQIWEEVHRSHRSHSIRTPIPEEEEEGKERKRCPSFKYFSLCLHSSGPSHLREEKHWGESDSSDDETQTLLPKEVKPKRPHPFIKLLLALWPFGEAFKELGILGKIYETIKVCRY